jgi:hypothetical protein
VDSRGFFYTKIYKMKKEMIKKESPVWIPPTSKEDLDALVKELLIITNRIADEKINNQLIRI